MKKNDYVSLEITGVTNEGNGVGRAPDGQAVFVPFTAVGDEISCKIVKTAKNYAYGIVQEIIKPSEYRCENDCEAFYKCGGCSFRHFTYEQELKIKQDFVRDSLERIGKLSPESEEILGCPQADGYRNKAQLPVASIDGKAVAGFFSKRSHRVMPLSDCKLQPKEFFEIVNFVLQYQNEKGLSCYDETTQKGLLRHIYIRRAEHTKETMLCLVVTKRTKDYDKLAGMLAEKFPQIVSVVLNINPKNTNVVLGNECITIGGKDTITDIMCKNEIEISPLSFYQVNTPQAERLYAIAQEYAQLGENDTLLDLYCGAGTIGLSMAHKVRKLIGVEIVAPAVENAKRNAVRNGIKNAEFICADAGKAAQSLVEKGEKIDVIIADPARKGCDKLSLDSMLKLSPKRIVMVSCNHATAARDCAYLEQNGYKVEKCRAVDLFPRTTHVECVISLRKESIKEKAFFENARLLSDALGITPLMYGSLGLQYLTGESLNADDIDVLIPEAFVTSRLNELADILSENGYTLTDEQEHTFEKNGISFSYASLQELEAFAGISLSDISVFNENGTPFMLLSLEQYLKVYNASSKDGYRVNVRGKKDSEKIAFIEKRLKQE